MVKPKSMAPSFSSVIALFYSIHEPIDCGKDFQLVVASISHKEPNKLNEPRTHFAF
jgi:hypothetical protein